MSRIWRHHHSYRKLCVDFRNHCLQAEILSAPSQIDYFQNGRQEVTATKYNLNKRLKLHSNHLKLLIYGFIVGIIFPHINCSN